MFTVKADTHAGKRYMFESFRISAEFLHERTEFSIALFSKNCSNPFSVIHVGDKALYKQCIVENSNGKSIEIIQLESNGSVYRTGR